MKPGMQIMPRPSMTSRFRRRPIGADRDDGAVAHMHVAAREIADGSVHRQHVAPRTTNSPPRRQRVL